MKTAIFDYGAGNLYSLRCALGKMDANPVITPTIPKIGEVDALVLPGVGSFTSVAKNLAVHRDEFLRLLDEGIPILGVCLGLQLFFEWSEEGEGKGLGLMRGGVVKVPSSVKVPHMGWNNLHIIKENAMTEGVGDNSWVYFVHSYYPKAEESDLVVAETTYGETFPVMISKNNVHGTQFHPEKSGDIGSILLRNFLNTCRR